MSAAPHPWRRPHRAEYRRHGRKATGADGLRGWSGFSGLPARSSARRWVTLWAARSSSVLRGAAIDLGGDTDTVAAVTGGLAGAHYGLDAILTRWTEPLHVPLPGLCGRVLRLADLLHLANCLLEEGRY